MRGGKHVAFLALPQWPIHGILAACHGEREGLPENIATAGYAMTGLTAAVVTPRPSA
jgi:hypothetical protein